MYWLTKASIFQKGHVRKEYLINAEDKLVESLIKYRVKKLCSYCGSSNAANRAYSRSLAWSAISLHACCSEAFAVKTSQAALEYFSRLMLPYFVFTQIIVAGANVKV